MKATFPIMAKCNVNGPDAHPVFKHLRKNTECFHNRSTGKVKSLPWNFCKFLIDEDGKILYYLGPR